MYLESPKIKLTLKPIDKWLEALALIGFVWLWIYCIRAFFILPETIPTHFNFKGIVDDYGSKSTILILPIIATVIYILITILNRYPHIFNYMVKVTVENAEAQYRFATRMLRVVKLFVIVLFGIVCIMVTNASNNLGISKWLGSALTIILALFTLITIGFAYKSTKTKRTA